jgi:preprotein translocase subunit YajC
MFITPAFAQTAGAAPGVSDMLIQIMPFILIMGIMWFLILRPQRQAQKRHQELLSNIRRGDTVVAGGFLAKVTKVVSDTELEVEIADNVKARVLRSLVTDVRAKGEPAAATPAKE